MPDADSVAVGPASRAPVTWVSEAGTATSRSAATRWPVGATRKICSLTPTAGGERGTVVDVGDGVEEVVGHGGPGDGRGRAPRWGCRRPTWQGRDRRTTAAAARARPTLTAPPRRRGERPSAGRRGQLDDEPGAAPGAASLHTAAPVEAHVLGHQREAEPRALAGRPLAGPAAAVEPLEEVAPLVVGDPRSLVLDHHPDGRGRARARRERRVRSALDEDAGDPTGVLVGVLHQVGHDPLEAALVDPEAQTRPRRGRPRRGR